MCAVILACAIVASVILYFAFARFPQLGRRVRIPVPSQDVSPPPALELSSTRPRICSIRTYIIARDGIWISQYLPGWPAILAMFELADLPSWLGGTGMRRPVGAPAVDRLAPGMPVTGADRRATARLCEFRFLPAEQCNLFLALRQRARRGRQHRVHAARRTRHVLAMARLPPAPALAWHCCAGSTAPRWPVPPCSPAGSSNGCRRRTLLLGIAGVAPLLIVFAAYNWLVTGNPLLPPTAWAGQIRFGADGLQGVEAAPAHFRMLIQTIWRLGELADTASLVVPALYLSRWSFEFVPATCASTTWCRLRIS